MKIVSKSRDYYDSVVGYGIDKTLTYIRTKEVLSLEHVDSRSELESFRRYIQDQIQYPIELDVIGFCGKFYVLVNFFIKSLHNDDHRILLERTSSRNLKNFWEKLKKIHKNEKYFQSSRFRDRDLYRKFKTSKTRHKSEIDKFNNYEKIIETYNYVSPYNCKSFDIFHELSCPVFVTTFYPENQKKTITKNPILKDLGFSKVLDPFTTFQELSLFIGGVLSQTQYPPIELSDQDKIAKKGFDKWSFRTPPSN